MKILHNGWMIMKKELQELVKLPLICMMIKEDNVKLVNKFIYKLKNKF